MPVAAWQVEAAMIEHAHDLGHGGDLQEHPKHKPQPLLNRHIGILDDHAARLARKADRQGESEPAALSFGENSPALPSAPDKKSFSSVSSPIFACSVFKSTAGALSLAVEPQPNSPDAPSSNCAFQA